MRIQFNLALIVSVILISLVCLTCDKNPSRKEQNPKNVNFERLRRFAGKHVRDVWKKGDEIKSFAGFDFESFLPLEHSDYKNSYADVHYDDLGSIVQIRVSGPFNNEKFAFRVIENDSIEYPILYAHPFRYANQKITGQIHGFFLVCGGHPYFITFGPSFCIMKLSKDLRAERVARFEGKGLLYYSIIRYDDMVILHSEAFSHPVKEFNVSDNTTLADVLSLLENDFEATFSVERRFGGLGDDAQRPLWIRGCHQEWDFDTPP